tara:strand:- start:2246 stop:2878 length:633 start_codon:yes stop_codon:yes gene_type:complete
MKQYVDLFLLAVLIIFLYDIPEFLNDIVNNTLGKLVLLSGVVCMLYSFGNTSGILAALIFILLIHKTKEGFEVSFGITREGYEGESKSDEKSSDKKGNEALKKKIKRLEKNQKKIQAQMEDKDDDSDKEKKKKEKKEEDEDEEEKEEFVGNREGYKNFSNSYHLKLNDLTEVNTVKGINFRNRTDMDRDLKISAEKNKIKATAARIDGTM